MCGTETRKAKLLEFLKYLPENYLIGIYYLDKTLNIPHYSIWCQEKKDFLLEKIESYNDDLEDSLIKVLLWRANPSKDYLIGVYDGLNMETGINDKVLE